MTRWRSRKAAPRDRHQARRCHRVHVVGDGERTRGGQRRERGGDALAAETGERHRRLVPGAPREHERSREREDDEQEGEPATVQPGAQAVEGHAEDERDAGVRVRNRP